jgi:DNA-directed RNA polymerase specialized sigma subunit
VKAPREIAKNIRNVSTAIENLSNALGREPSVYEIRDQLEKKDILIDELTISEIRTLIDLNSGNDDQFISEYKEQYIEEPESELINLMKINILKDFEKLSKNVAEELDMRFGITYDHPFNKEEVDYILYAKPKRL